VSTATLPLQPGRIRLMLIWDMAAIRIIDAEIFTDGDEAVQARANLRAGLDGEFRDYPVSLPGFVSAAELHKHLTEQAAIEQDVADDMSEGANEQRWRDACGHWGAARALRDVLKYIDREAEAQQETSADEMCPGGCGCRLGTDDADRLECGCDAGCCGEEDSR
jgi:hypothetical protein